MHREPHKPAGGQLGQMVNVRSMQSQVCMGIKFLKVSRQEEKVIDRFILDEQRKLIKTYKVGEDT